MTEEKEKQVSRYRRWVLIMAIQFAAVCIFAIQGATAGPIEDIPSGMAAALGTNVDVAKLILSCGILMSAGIAMAVVGKGQNMMGTMVILLSIEGALTAIGWLLPWLLLLTAVLIAAMFAGKMKESLAK
jgi:hypothetical protein